LRIKFKSQAYQSAAVEAVIDCFQGQPKNDGIKYRMDKGVAVTDHQGGQQAQMDYDGDAGESAFKNAPIQLDEAALLHNIQQVQSRQNLPVNQSLTEFTEKNKRNNQLEAVKAKYTKMARAIAPLHLDVEMETGTGKTYCYIKTIFEMNQRFGWSKFIIVVPSIAIREGVTKSLEITANHFADTYNKKARFFTYNSKNCMSLKAIHRIVA
jgi:type III restriction enzyme